ncbi:uncharacterized protein LOC106158774 [Lingula anatina]|uniref:Uncharacterized protein LOC106158774 n=1 Tax=Lingula anatina TaxID=7574 RepID=A0A1S3HZ19_LINAN|nr:uncharacterized protein LOC106158774 [Lingula anatina]|eukprot:XP_013390329.1 uncharacterized protein LOC106158774 [Lingula anatina]
MKIGTTTTPSITNGSVSQRHKSGNTTETTPTFTETSPISSINQSGTTNNKNIDNATQTTATSTASTPTTTGATPTPGVQGWIIATAVSTSVAGLLILCCVGVCVYLCCQDNEDCCLCCCCKDYDDCEECREGCRDWFSDCCENCFSRCVCKSDPEATPMVAQAETEITEPVHFISVHLPDGQSLRMSVRSTDKIRVIKTKVIELVNLPLYYVNVYHGLMPGESDSLDEDISFTGYGIYFGTDQEFTVTYTSHSVLVQFADGSLEEQSWDPLLTVGDFLNMIDLKSQAARKDMLLIEAQWEGRAALQELVESDKKTLLYRLRKIKVSVSFQVVLKIIGQNTQISVKVFPTDTVNALAKNFLKAVIFIYEGTQLGSDKTLKDYGLQEGSVVTVGWSVKVSVARGGQIYKYSLLASNVVGELKQILAVDTDIHLFEQHLSFNGNVLSDDKMLAEYLTSKMEEEMDIILTSQPWRVSVLLPTGTLRDYQVSPNNNVAFLKNQIEADADIPVSRQILQIGRNDLADDGLLCDSIVPSSSLIYLKEQIALKYSSNWTPVSARWRPFFEELLQVSDGNLKEVNNVCFSTKIDRFKIGSGNKTEVFLGIRHDGREVAVKRFPRSMSQNFKNEKGLLTTLDSPNIIRYLDIAMDDEFLYLILELGEFTLNEFISTDEYKQNQTNISRELVGQILESLRTLHTGHNVIHMDIKPHNVLIDISNRAKLSDFGISVVLPDNQSTFYTTAKGTYHWVAKEILDSATGKVKYKKNADIQVAGMLVYYTLTGGIHPFMPNGEADVFLCNKNVQDGKHDLSALDDIVGKHLVDWMLQPDPELRPTIEEALAHPFFWNVDMRYRFLGVLGDEKEVKESWKQQPHSVTLTLDGLTVSVFNTVAHWKDLLDQVVYDEVSKPMRNGYRSTICGLLRFMRNVDVHLKDQPPTIQTTVGNPMTYFTAKLPFDELFLKVYKTVRDTRSSADDWTVRGSLKEFFPA